MIDAVDVGCVVVAFGLRLFCVLCCVCVLYVLCVRCVLLCVCFGGVLLLRLCVCFCACPNGFCLCFVWRVLFCFLLGRCTCVDVGLVLCVLCVCVVV